MTGASLPACATRAPSSRPKGTGVRNGEFEAQDTQRDYHHWLPGLHARYQLDKTPSCGRPGPNAVVRPTFGQLAPGFVIDDDVAEFGNPNLKPLESSNFDLGIEHYMGRAGTVSAFLFYKDIKNFVYNNDLAGSGIWTDFTEAHSYANGDSASLLRAGTGVLTKIRLAACALEWRDCGRQQHLQPLQCQHQGG